MADDDGGDLDDPTFEHLRSLLMELDDADRRRVDPPADLWGRIDAAVAAGSPKDAPARLPGAGTVVEYWIDADDVVRDVGRQWGDFARANGAPELARPSTDRTLWSYIDHVEVRELWQLLVQRVRATQRAAQVPLRCDGPEHRRWYEMTLTADPAGRVHVESTLVFEEQRDSVALLDPATPRDSTAEPVELCSWCGHGSHDGRWVDIEELVRAGRLLESSALPPLSYGICGSCCDDMSAELLVPTATESD